jgi:hypothetical protein
MSQQASLFDDAPAHDCAHAPALHDGGRCTYPRCRCGWPDPRQIEGDQ